MSRPPALDTPVLASAPQPHDPVSPVSNGSAYSGSLPPAIPSSESASSAAFATRGLPQQSPPTLFSAAQLRRNDRMFSVFVIGSLVVAFWRSTWYIFDAMGCSDAAGVPSPYLFCSRDALEREHNGWVGFVVGTVVTAVAAVARPAVAGFAGPPHAARHFNTRMVLAYVLGVASILLWRGVWYVADTYVYPDSLERSAWACLAAGAALLFATTSFKTTISPPAVVTLDEDVNPDDPLPLPQLYLSTRFPTASWLREAAAGRLLDALTTACVVAVGVVLFWRGVWALLDHYTHIHPEWSVLRTAWLSTVLGSGVVFAACWLRPRLQRDWPSRRLVAVLDRLHAVVLSAASVAYWRGVWYLSDLYVFPDTFVLSITLSHVGSLVLLVLFGTLTSMVASPAATALDAGDLASYPSTFYRQLLTAHRPALPRSDSLAWQPCVA